MTDLTNRPAALSQMYYAAFLDAEEIYILISTQNLVVSARAPTYSRVRAGIGTRRFKRFLAGRKSTAKEAALPEVRWPFEQPNRRDAMRSTGKQAAAPPS
jgi:hypothetical protein